MQCSLGKIAAIADNLLVISFEQHCLSIMMSTKQIDFFFSGGYSQVYVSISDFYGQPHLEEVVWVCTGCFSG